MTVGRPLFLRLQPKTDQAADGLGPCQLGLRCGEQEGLAAHGKADSKYTRENGWIKRHVARGFGPTV